MVDLRKTTIFAFLLAFVVVACLPFVAYATEVGETGEFGVSDAAVQSEVVQPDSNQASDQANSWRYVDGVLEVEEDQYAELFALSGSARSIAPWSKTEAGYVNSRGDLIPNAVRKGIDVSKYQGYIDWDKVKADGIDFAIIRCGYGSNYTTQDDSQWMRNVSECERLGIPYGVYLYSYAKDVYGANDEADHVLRLLAGHKPTYPVYYDLEENSMASASKRGVLAQMATVFCNRVSQAGYTPGIYANLYWWNNFLTDGVFNNWPKWVAQYNVRCDYTGDYQIWQCTSKGAVNGISADVDINFELGYFYGGALDNNAGYGHWVSEGGSWYWYDGSGTRATGLKAIGGKKYFFDNNGCMLTGLQFINNRLYYFAPSGAMQFGWQKIGGAWYFFSMTTGAALTDWHRINGAWYNLNVEGKMRSGWFDEAGARYYLGGADDGAMRVGWYNVFNTWYYANDSGAMQAGWLPNGGSWYYLTPGTGAMAEGWVSVEGYWYYLTPGSGAMRTGWINDGGTWYWCDSSGAMASSRWLQSGDAWYYLTETGAMATDTWVGPYRVGPDGRWVQ